MAYGICITHASRRTDLNKPPQTCLLQVPHARFEGPYDVLRWSLRALGDAAGAAEAKRHMQQAASKRQAVPADSTSKVAEAGHLDEAASKADKDKAAPEQAGSSAASDVDEARRLGKGASKADKDKAATHVPEAAPGSTCSASSTDSAAPASAGAGAGAVSAGEHRDNALGCALSAGADSKPRIGVGFTTAKRPTLFIRTYLSFRCGLNPDR